MCRVWRCVCSQTALCALAAAVRRTNKWRNKRAKMTSPVAKMATEANASCGVNWMVRPWALAARSSTAADDVHDAIAFMRIILRKVLHYEYVTA